MDKWPIYLCVIVSLAFMAVLTFFLWRQWTTGGNQVATHPPRERKRPRLPGGSEQTSERGIPGAPSKAPERRRQPPKPIGSPSIDSQGATGSRERLERYIGEDVQRLREAGYDPDEIKDMSESPGSPVFYLRVPHLYEGYTAHFVCRVDYPGAAPEVLIGQSKGLNDYGEIIEEKVELSLDMLQRWQASNCLLDAVQEIIRALDEKKGRSTGEYFLNAYGEIVRR